MIFQAFHDKVQTDINPDGPKTMTRRVARLDDYLFFEEGAMTVDEYLANLEYNRRHFAPFLWKVERNDRSLYRLGQQLSNQPGRGKRANGRTPPVTEIRLERVGEITEADCIAEGLTVVAGIGSECISLVERFAKTWDGLHPEKDERWPDCPNYVINWGQPSPATLRAREW